MGSLVQEAQRLKGEEAMQPARVSLSKPGPVLRPAAPVADPVPVQPSDPEGERLRLYEAFNDLQALAKKFDRPFAAPAILVLGHQTDGKSALVEALVGFQFNTVGGGTTTRRPVVLQMQYNAACSQPSCNVMLDDGREKAMSLTELQTYIKEANAKLEEQQQFSPREILVNIQYKHSPNLCIIDTPGLISAAPGKANASLQAASRAIEQLVRQKAEIESLILLCLEDVSDWTHATTRRLAMQADPQLSRTVLVSTKLDARIPTFSRPADVETFLHPASLGDNMLGGAPFFTSVPAGRVGDEPDAVLPSQQEFRAALQARETQDVTELESKLQRRLSPTELSHLGVGSLRSFLESLLRERYLEQVPAVLAALEAEHRAVQARQAELKVHLEALNQSDLKERGRQLTEDFLLHLGRLLHGNACPPVGMFGQTLTDEHAVAGCAKRKYETVRRRTVPQMECPELSREEVANACGLEDAHDGANYLRAACIIAVAKARAIFEPFLHQLGQRLSHVLRQMQPATMYMLQAAARTSGAHTSESDMALVRVIADKFNSFISEAEDSCRSRCLEDLMSTTRYVTWSLHTKSSKSLHSVLSKVVLKPPFGLEGNKNAPVKETKVKEIDAATILEELLFSRHITPTSEVLVAALVAQMFEGVRDYVVQSAELKFLSFFLMPVVDQFPQRLRSAMELLYERDLDAVFNTAHMRQHMEAQIATLQAELHQVDRLISKFTSVQSQLQKQILAVRSTMQRRDAKPALPGPALGAAAATAAFANMSIAAAGASAGSAGAAAGGAGEVPALGASASPLKAPGKLTQTGSLYRSKLNGPSRLTNDAEPIRDSGNAKGPSTGSTSSGPQAHALRASTIDVL